MSQQQVPDDDVTIEIEPSPAQGWLRFFKRSPTQPVEEVEELLLPHESKSTLLGFFISTPQLGLFLIFFISLVGFLTVNITYLGILGVFLLVYNFFRLKNLKNMKAKLFWTIITTIVQVVCGYFKVLPLLIVLVLIIWLLIHIYRSVFYRIEVTESGVTFKKVTFFFFSDKKTYYYSSLSSLNLTQNELEKRFDIGDIFIKTNGEEINSIDDIGGVSRVYKVIDDHMKKTPN